MPTAAEKRAAAEAEKADASTDPVDTTTEPETVERPNRVPNTPAWRVIGADGEAQDHVVLGDARRDVKERGGSMSRLF